MQSTLVCRSDKKVRQRGKGKGVKGLSHKAAYDPSQLDNIARRVHSAPPCQPPAPARTVTATGAPTTSGTAGVPMDYRGSSLSGLRPLGVETSYPPAQGSATRVAGDYSPAQHMADCLVTSTPLPLAVPPGAVAATLPGTLPPDAQYTLPDCFRQQVLAALPPGMQAVITIAPAPVIKQEPPEVIDLTDEPPQGTSGATPPAISIQEERGGPG